MCINRCTGVGSEQNLLLRQASRTLDNLTSTKQKELADKLKTAESKISGFGEDLLKKLKAQAKLPKFKL